MVGQTWHMGDLPTNRSFTKFFIRDRTRCIVVNETINIYIQKILLKCAIGSAFLPALAVDSLLHRHPLYPPCISSSHRSRKMR